jgi:hypothetical protein
MQLFSSRAKSGLLLSLAFLISAPAYAAKQPSPAPEDHKMHHQANQAEETQSAHTQGHSMKMHGMYGAYSMTKESSGTSWQPESTPFMGQMFMWGKTMFMVQGFANFIHDHQGGPRGNDLDFSTSMLMFMIQRDLDIGTLGFHSMFSLDPLMGNGGYPLLLQTGETANGLTPLIDRQHPHDAVMELALSYSLPLAEKQSAFIYVGLPGEPALGPPNFMMRWSGRYIPEAPIVHHWLDSTHITYGVVTLGYIFEKAKLEFSAFNGREPDQNRWTIESPQLDSESLRFSYNPTDNWSLQASYGRIKSPEQLEPEVNTNRSTLSAMYNRPIGSDSNWQTTAAWGQDANHPGHTLNGYLLESTVNFHQRHSFFGRFERVQNDELFQPPSHYVHQVFTPSKLSLGYLFELPYWRYAKPGIGALVSTYSLPSILQQAYGSRPFSYMIFGRISL